jgi:hypothetical protein
MGGQRAWAAATAIALVSLLPPAGEGATLHITNVAGRGCAEWPAAAGAVGGTGGGGALSSRLSSPFNYSSRGGRTRRCAPLSWNYSGWGAAPWRAASVVCNRDGTSSVVFYGTLTCEQPNTLDVIGAYITRFMATAAAVDDGLPHRNVSLGGAVAVVTSFPLPGTHIPHDGACFDGIGAAEPEDNVLATAFLEAYNLEQGYPLQRATATLGGAEQAHYAELWLAYRRRLVVALASARHGWRFEVEANVSECAAEPPPPPPPPRVLWSWGISGSCADPPLLECGDAGCLAREQCLLEGGAPCMSLGGGFVHCFGAAANRSSAACVARTQCGARHCRAGSNHTALVPPPAPHCLAHGACTTALNSLGAPWGSAAVRFVSPADPADDARLVAAFYATADCSGAVLDVNAHHRREVLRAASSVAATITSPPPGSGAEWLPGSRLNLNLFGVLRVRTRFPSNASCPAALPRSCGPLPTTLLAPTRSPGEGSGGGAAGSDPRQRCVDALAVVIDEAALEREFNLAWHRVRNRSQAIAPPRPISVTQAAFGGAPAVAPSSGGRVD